MEYITDMSQSITTGNIETDALIEQASKQISQEEARILGESVRTSMISYVAKPVGVSDEEWLCEELKTRLPGMNEEDIKNYADEIVSQTHRSEQKRIELKAAIESGRSAESWLSSEILKATSAMTTLESAQYLSSLDNAVKNANAAMRDAITTQSDTVNMNMNLDGFIAEQSHVNSFNMSAAAKGSDLHAEVLKPDAGSAYGKNSVDIVVKDSSGKIVQRYQAKYGATAKDTIRMVKQGDYRGQRLLVPKEQVQEVQEAFPDRKVQAIIEADGAESKPLSKDEAKQKQNETQKSGNILEQNWSDFSKRDIAIGIAKGVGNAALGGAVVGAGVNLIGQALSGEEIDGAEVIETALKTGVDTGVKYAASCGIKCASEAIAASTGATAGLSGSACATIGFAAVENVKVLGELASGELTPTEAVDEMTQTTIASVGSMHCASALGSLGATVGAALGPVGAAVGGVVGGVIGGIAGSKVGRAVGAAAKTVVHAAGAVVKGVAKAAGAIACGVASVVTAPFRAISGDCYITSAVCEKSGKPDDCYELTMLRDFRDNWLKKQPGGEQLVYEYYKTAPALIEKLNANPVSEAIYVILENCIENCICILEKGEYEMCKNEYVKMSRWLMRTLSE